MQPPPNAPQRQLKIDIDKDMKPTYANTVIISHTQFEVVLDFIQILPSDPRARVLERIIMTPTHAKMFLQAMAENVARYEARFGVIPMPPRPNTLADQLFSTVANPPAPEGDGGNE